MPSDGQRTFPVDYLVMHHSAGPDFANATDQEVSDWFSIVGKSRGYASLAHSGHFDPDTGAETFSMAHWALRPYTRDNNKYGWRLTLLMADPEQNVAWHCGLWAVNQRSFGIETCGIYLADFLPDQALMLVADSFREHDRQLVAKGYASGLQVFGHQTFFLTECPGQILHQLPKLIDMINNPEAWNARLWPDPTPAPAPAPEKPEWVRRYRPFATPDARPLGRATELLDFETGQVKGAYPAGHVFEGTGTTEYQGRRYVQSAYSVGRGLPVGIRQEDFDYQPPAPTPTPAPGPAPSPVPAEYERWLVDTYNFNKQWFSDHKED